MVVNSDFSAYQLANQDVHCAIVQSSTTFDANAVILPKTSTVDALTKAIDKYMAPTIIATGRKKKQVERPYGESITSVDAFVKIKKAENSRKRRMTKDKEAKADLKQTKGYVLFAHSWPCMYMIVFIARERKQKRMILPNQQKSRSISAISITILVLHLLMHPILVINKNIIFLYLRRMMPPICLLLTIFLMHTFRKLLRISRMLILSAIRFVTSVILRFILIMVNFSNVTLVIACVVFNV